MRKTKKAAEATVEKKQFEAASVARVAKMMPKENDERYMRVADAWRAILGLPRDFVIGPFQVTVCMGIANIIVCDDQESA